MCHIYLHLLLKIGHFLSNLRLMPAKDNGGASLKSFLEEVTLIRQSKHTE